MYLVEGGKRLKECLKTCVKENVPVLISGASGIGKSEIVQQVAEELNLPYHEIRLYLMEPGEAKGLPDIVDLRTIWTRPDWLPEEECILMFDDIHLATEQLQSPLFELLLCNRLHGHPVPGSVRFIAAGNLSMHAAGANEILAPVMDRFKLAVHFRPTPEDFAKYARDQGIEPKIISFILSHPDYLFTEEPPTSRKFPSPRSWFALSENLKYFPIDIAVGVVGEEAGAKIIDAWDLLGVGVKELLKKKLESIKDQVVVSATLARYKPTEEVLDFVHGKLELDAQFCYYKSLAIFRREDFKKLLMKQDPRLLELADEIIRQVEE